MLCLMMLCVIIADILTSLAPINVEVHCFQLFLLDCFVHDVVCSGVIRSQRRWGLCVTQLGECYPERGATLGVVEASSNF
jgi:hypothetical protein